MDGSEERRSLGLQIIILNCGGLQIRRNGGNIHRTWETAHSCITLWNKIYGLMVRIESLQQWVTNVHDTKHTKIVIHTNKSSIR